MVVTKKTGSGRGRKGQNCGFICGKISLLEEYRQTDRQTDGHRTVDRAGGGGGAKGWAVLSSNLLVEAAPHPPGGQGSIGTGGDETGVRCPSPRWAAGQSPVLVGTIGSLWTSCDAGEGAGLLDYPDAEAKGTPGERGYQGLS